MTSAKRKAMGRMPVAAQLQASSVSSRSPRPLTVPLATPSTRMGLCFRCLARSAASSSRAPAGVLQWVAFFYELSMKAAGEPAA